MYPPNRNPTEMYYERHALLRQEARNKRLARRPLAALSTLLVVILAFAGLVSILVGPGVAIDYVGTYLLPGAWMIGVLAAVVGLLMLGAERLPKTERNPPTGSTGTSGELPRRQERRPYIRQSRRVRS